MSIQNDDQIRNIPICDVSVRQAISLACMVNTNKKTINFVCVSHINSKASEIACHKKNIILITDTYTHSYLFGYHTHTTLI